MADAAQCCGLSTLHVLLMGSSHCATIRGHTERGLALRTRAAACRSICFRECRMFHTPHHRQQTWSHGAAVLWLGGGMPRRQQAIEGARGHAPSMEETVRDLRATSRIVTAEICRLRQQIKRANDRRALPVSHYHQLVLKTIARQSTAPMPACLVYIVQHCPLRPDVASDQLHVVELESFVQEQIRTATLPCIDLAAAPEQRTRVGDRAWRAAATHLADLELAQWAAGCNTQQRVAPTTAQMHTKRSSLMRLFGLRERADGNAGSAQRRQRRSLQRWRQRWGFRYGKMKLRDHFADGELLRKAPPTSSFFISPAAK